MPEKLVTLACASLDYLAHHAQAADQAIRKSAPYIEAFFTDVQFACFANVSSNIKFDQGFDLSL